MELQEKIKEALSDPRFYKALIEAIEENNSHPFKVLFSELTDEQKVKVLKAVFKEHPKEDLENLFRRAFEDMKKYN